MPFLHCKNERKRAQNVQNSEFAYYASKSGKWIKQTPTPPFWGDVGVKKWSPFLVWCARSPIFGRLNMGIFGQNCQKCPCSGAQKWDFERPKPKTETTFSRQHPPKMVEQTFVSCVFQFWMSIKQILKNCIFWAVLSRFSLSTHPKIGRSCAGSI